MRKSAIFWVLILLIPILQSCSVQEKMNPQIFFERFLQINKNFVFDTSEQFFDGNEFVCFVDDLNGKSFVFQLSSDDYGDCKKISVCAEKTERNIFKECVESIIRVYAPEDNPKNIIDSLYSDGNNQKIRYFETQWHIYSAVEENETCYFSVSSKKLASESEVDLSLKPNDKADF